MSFIHRLIVGHFDLYTIDGFGHPLPLRSLDMDYVKRLLTDISTPVADETFEIEGDKIYIGDGYCDCPTRFQAARDFAFQLAKTESCIVAESRGPNVVLYPPEAAALYWKRGQQPPTQQAGDEALIRNEPDELRQVVVEASWAAEEWAGDFCAGLATHADFNVRGNAFYALAWLAFREYPLDRERVQPIIEAALADGHPYVRGHALKAAKEAESGLHWVFCSFDNGKPAQEVKTYSDGWVKCPRCNLRFSTRDPHAFREGRCLRCRQKLRIVGHTGR